MLTNFDKILFTFSFSYLLGVSGWLISQNQLNLSGLSKNVESSAKSLTSEQAEFIKYMQHALQEIDTKPSTNSLSSINNNGDRANSDKYLEKTKDYLAPKQGSQLFEKLKIEVDSPAKLPHANSSLANSLLPSFVDEASNSSSLSDQEPHFQYTLLGLLESQEKSLALFDLNGITKKINIGETIGDSNCVLVAIANQQAIISEDGQLKFINVGQKL